MKFFEGYGRIVDCRVMTGAFSEGKALVYIYILFLNILSKYYFLLLFLGFGFVEFENSRVYFLSFG